MANHKYDYLVIERKGYLPAMLPFHAFCPLNLRDHPGLEDPYAANGASASKKGFPIPIFSAQATFIPGGLVLSTYWHHSVLDAMAFDQFVSVWSGYVTRLNKGIDMSVCDRIDPVNSSAHRRALDALIPAVASATAGSSFETIIMPTKEHIPTLHSDKYNVAAKITCFPVSAISILKDELQALTETRISTFITLVSLMYTHATRARSSALLNAGCTTVGFTIAVHMGKRACPISPVTTRAI